MPFDPDRVQAIFLAAVEYSNLIDRAVILDRECSTDRELRQRVETLLRANDQPDRFLDQPVVGLAGTSSDGSAVEDEARSAGEVKTRKKEA
jgi:hypothetical protein